MRAPTVFLLYDYELLEPSLNAEEHDLPLLFVHAQNLYTRPNLHERQDSKQEMRSVAVVAVARVVVVRAKGAVVVQQQAIIEVVGR